MVRRVTDEHVSPVIKEYSPAGVQRLLYMEKWKDEQPTAKDGQGEFSLQSDGQKHWAVTEECSTLLWVCVCLYVLFLF